MVVETPLERTLACKLAERGIVLDKRVSWQEQYDELRRRAYSEKITGEPQGAIDTLQHTCTNLMLRRNQMLLQREVTTEPSFMRVSEQYRGVHLAYQVYVPPGKSEDADLWIEAALYAEEVELLGPGQTLLASIFPDRDTIGLLIDDSVCNDAGIPAAHLEGLTAFYGAPFKEENVCCAVFALLEGGNYLFLDGKT
jgi:hypothetical protein